MARQSSAGLRILLASGFDSLNLSFMMRSFCRGRRDNELSRVFKLVLKPPGRKRARVDVSRFFLNNFRNEFAGAGGQT